MKIKPFYHSLCQTKVFPKGYPTKKAFIIQEFKGTPSSDRSKICKFKFEMRNECLRNILQIHNKNDFDCFKKKKFFHITGALLAELHRSYFTTSMNEFIIFHLNFSEVLFI